MRAASLSRTPEAAAPACVSHGSSRREVTPGTGPGHCLSPRRALKIGLQEDAALGPSDSQAHRTFCSYNS
ncbi:hypothetical protein NDU88_005950 [Pleurodeles waltl]|uniref:Uncharacterized protein n=1 Tax=Pleurodeles waltl TaxID=8319 RepID=A0AAV7PGW9_PLEWA|nr:hypothetical protein NDU88_005950 [Pleurodeles waltl]